MIARLLSGLGWSKDSAMSSFFLIPEEKQDETNTVKRADMNNAFFMAFICSKIAFKK